MQTSRSVEVAHIFRQHGPEYRKTHPLPVPHLRAMRAIEICRTSELGGHVERCDTCGARRISYNSCRNRHCPKCQFLRKEQWLEARNKDLLPIPYFHVVFTIPDDLNPITLRNPKVMYTILFQAVSETLTKLARDPKHLGAQIGFIAILHTWGQNLMDHPHIHCVVTGGGLSPDGQKWVSCKKKFFLPVEVMSSLFRGKFLAYFKQRYDSDDLIPPGHLQDHDAFKKFLKVMYNREWVVYCKPPFNGSEGVLRYLGRYTHRIAIGNHRIINMQDDRVSFLWRDYSDDDKNKVMTLKVSEFIRRFLLHVLPPRFVKIRHYGLLGNRNRKTNLLICRKHLNCIHKATDKDMSETWQELLLRISGVDITKCPVCEKGTMHRTEFLLPYRCNGPP